MLYTLLLFNCSDLESFHVAFCEWTFSTIAIYNRGQATIVSYTHIHIHTYIHTLKPFGRCVSFIAISAFITALHHVQTSKSRKAIWTSDRTSFRMLAYYLSSTTTTTIIQNEREGRWLRQRNEVKPHLMLCQRKLHST